MMTFSLQSTPATAGSHRTCRQIGLLLVAISLMLPAWLRAAPDDTSPSPSPRIIGGVASAPGSWPAVGALLLNVPGNIDVFLRQFCGASLIDSRHALTAAHCVVDADGGLTLPGEISVLFGAVDLADGKAGEEVGVTSVFAHPQYRPGAFYHDIAVLELDREVQREALALATTDPADLVGREMDIVGWGATGFDDFGNAVFDTQLREARVPIVSNATCNAFVSYGGSIDENQFCAGLAPGGVDACAGDSGGPALLRVEGRQIQLGIVSYGRGCAQANYYGVYTDVSAFRSWIEQYASPSYLSRSDLVFDDTAAAPVEGGGGSGSLGPLGLLVAGIAGLGARRRRSLRCSRHSRHEGPAPADRRIER